MPGKNKELADSFAKDYDNSVLKNNWIGPQILFEISFNLIKPESRILDLGIGTGESSKLFQKEGHFITGMDGSEKMLEQCQKKKIASELVLHDLEKTPFPLINNSFDAVISNGVFHLIHPVSPIFKEVKRLLNPYGYFIFTFENANDTKDYQEIKTGIWQKQTSSGVLTFKHSENYIRNMLLQNDFKIIKQKEFLAFQNKELDKNYFFMALMAKL